MWTSRSPLGQLPATPLGESPWPERQPVDTPRRPSSWAVPWSDLMMTMFVLFAVLYALQGARMTPSGPRETPTPVVLATVAPPAAALPGPLREAADQLRRLSDSPGVLTVEIISGGVRLALAPHATPAPLLNEVSRILAGIPLPVQVVGHGRGPKAWEKASRAAESIAQTLKGQGVAENRLWVTARYGDDAPTSALDQDWVDILLGAAPQLPPPHPLVDVPHIAAWLRGGI